MALYYKEKTTTEISVTLGITEHSVRRIASDLGIKRSDMYVYTNDIEVKEIPNYSRYMVDENGRIFRKKDLALLKYSLNAWGYFDTKLVDDNGIRKNVRVHRIVCYAFYGFQESDIQVNHIDGNKVNNRIENLEWTTASENLKHAYKNNLRESLIGNKNNRSKLTEYDVRNICEWYLDNTSVREISDILEEMGKPMKLDSIRQILRGQRWGHIVKEYNINYIVNENMQRLEKS